MAALTSLTLTKSRVVATDSKDQTFERGRHLATLYRVHDGKKVIASFQVLTDALKFTEQSESYKLITVNYYQNGIEEMPAHIN